MSKVTESLGYVLVLLSMLLLLCWFGKNEGFKNFMSKKGTYGTFKSQDGMNNKLASSIGGVYFARRTDVNNAEGLSDLETSMNHRGKKNKPYVDLKWASEALIGINKYEGIDNASDVAKANSVIGGEMITIPPNPSKSCDSSCKSTGGYQLANIDFNSNVTTIRPVYGNGNGYVTI